MRISPTCQCIDLTIYSQEVVLEGSCCSQSYYRSLISQLGCQNVHCLMQTTQYRIVSCLSTNPTLKKNIRRRIAPSLNQPSCQLQSARFEKPSSSGAFIDLNIRLYSGPNFVTQGMTQHKNLFLESFVETSLKNK